MVSASTRVVGFLQLFLGAIISLVLIYLYKMLSSHYDWELSSTTRNVLHILSMVPFVIGAAFSYDNIKGADEENN